MTREQQLQLAKRRKRWHAKPSTFVKDVFGVKPRPAQTEALDALTGKNPRARVALHGYRGLGKTALLAWYAIIFISLYRDAIVVMLTAGGMQLREILFPELRYWFDVADRRGWRIGDPPQRTRWEPYPGTRCIGVTPREPGRIQGFHPRERGPIATLVDEPSFVLDPVYEATHGYDQGAGICHRLACGIPGVDHGWFHKAVHTDSWKPIHVDGEADPFSDKQWIKERAEDWGPSSALYMSEARGLFYTDSDFGLCDPMWLRRARNGGGPDVVREGDTQLGWDVGAGGDLNAGYARRAGLCIGAVTTKKANTMETAGDIIAFGREHKSKLWMVDEGGIGLGVVHRLQEQGFPAQGYNAANKARDPEHYRPRRAEDAWGLRTRFEQDRMDISQMPEDYFKRFSYQATTIRWRRNSSGQTILESKADYKGRLGRQRGTRHSRSPDELDAGIYAHAGSRMPAAPKGMARAYGKRR